MRRLANEADVSRISGTGRSKQFWSLGESRMINVSDCSLNYMQMLYQTASDISNHLIHLSCVVAVSKVSQARYNVALLVQTLIDESRHDTNSRELLGKVPSTLRACN